MSKALLSEIPFCILFKPKRVLMCVYTAICPAGNQITSPDPSGTCRPCDIGFYQNLTGQAFCWPCAADQTTANTGSTSSSVCFGKCWLLSRLMYGSVMERSTAQSLSDDILLKETFDLLACKIYGNICRCEKRSKVFRDYRSLCKVYTCHMRVFMCVCVCSGVSIWYTASCSRWNVSELFHWLLQDTGTARLVCSVSDRLGDSYCALR